MGVGYNRNLVQWSKGEYANANQKQDDYLIMQNQGVPFDQDEHGDTVGTATALSGSVINGLQVFKANGVLQGPSDSDHISFVANAGTLTIDVKSLGVNTGNADLLISLLDSSENLLAQSNNLDTLGTSLSFNLQQSGTYFLKVEGTGKGDPLGTGYTKYGSVGYWNATINAQLTSGNLPPSARITADKTAGEAPLVVNFSAAGSADPEGTNLTYSWSFGDGSSATGITASKTYQAAGSYTASVLVTDAGGLTGSASQNITVTAPVEQTTMSVASIEMTGGLQKAQRFANAAITIRDSSGKIVPSATVTGSWSGAVSGTASGITGSNGQITFKSPNTKRGGTFTFTVSSVSKSGFVYQPGSNVMTSNSVTVQ
jgi:PKD repeat protein